MTSEKELYDKSLEQWGLPAQIIMLAEEALELSHAAIKVWRGKDPDLEHLAEEIADTQFMIDEFLYYFTNHPELAMQPSLVRRVGVYRQLKRERLERLLKGDAP